MQEERVNQEELDEKSLEALFSENQETLEEAQARRNEEEKSFVKVKYFTMDKEKTYKIRILPLPPSSPRRGYEYPLHEYMMKLKNPENGKIKYVNACRATEAGFSVDLIDTYRKLALKEVKGDEELEKKIKGGSFGGGLGMDYKRVMYIYDLNNTDEGMMIWKASNGQFKSLEEVKETFWKQLIENTEDPKTPCPVSSWNKAYPVEIKKKKAAKTEYVFSINPFAKSMKMTNDELKSLMNATPISDIVYRFSKYHLEAEIEFLKQYDETTGMGIMESQEIIDTIAKLKSELPANDDSSFSFKASSDNEDDNDQAGMSIDEISNAYDKFIDEGGQEKSEEGQELRALVIEYIKRKDLDIKITRQKSISNLLDEIENAIDDLGEEPKDKEAPKTTQVKKVVNEKKEDEDYDEDNEDENEDDEEENNPRKKRNDDTNEPAIRRKRRGGVR